MNGSVCVVRWLLADVTYLCYTVLTSSNKSETAVHSWDPALSVFVMLVSRNVFPVVIRFCFFFARQTDPPGAMRNETFYWDGLRPIQNPTKN